MATDMGNEELEEGTEQVETEITAEQQVLIDKARRLGWRPKDEYNGPESRWVDYEAFIARGEQELPVLRERMRHLDTRFAATERELTDAKSRIVQQSEVLTELRDLSLQAQKRGYDQAMRELGERERKAVQEADTAEYDRVQIEKRELAPPPAKKEVVNPPPPSPVSQADTITVTDWIADNPWFNADRELNSMATSIHGSLRQLNPTQPLMDNLEEVKQRIVRMYPDKFENPRRKTAATVATSASPAPRTKGKTVHDLPSEAKEALAKFKKMMPGYTDADYLKSYFGDEA